MNNAYSNILNNYFFNLLYLEYTKLGNRSELDI